MKSISGVVEVHKLPFFAVLEPLIFKFGKFQPSKIAKFSFTQDSEPLKTQKMTDFELLELLTLISRKL